MGKLGFPIPPPAGGLRPHAGAWGNPGCPIPPPAGGLGRRAAPTLMRAGGPRTQAPARGRVWEGGVLPGASVCSSVGVRRGRMDGYREHRLLTYAHAALPPLLTSPFTYRVFARPLSDAVAERQHARSVCQDFLARVRG